MVIYFNVGGKEHSYLVPIYDFNFKIPHVGPGPVNIPYLIFDASILASVEEAASKLSDTGVREALMKGIVAAVEALQKRGGARISLETAGGAATGGGTHGPGR